MAECPDVDALVNNLRIYEAVDFFDTTDDQRRRLFEVNVLSGVRLSRHYLPRMLSRGTGRVVFVSSESAINPAPEMARVVKPPATRPRSGRAGPRNGFPAIEWPARVGSQFREVRSELL